MFFFFFNDTATTEIYTLPLHDALPISLAVVLGKQRRHRVQRREVISTIRGVRYRDSWHQREATQRQIGNAGDWVGAIDGDICIAAAQRHAEISRIPDIMSTPSACETVYPTVIGLPLILERQSTVVVWRPV